MLVQSDAIPRLKIQFWNVQDVLEKFKCQLYFEVYQEGFPEKAQPNLYEKKIKKKFS